MTWPIYSIQRIILQIFTLFFFPVAEPAERSDSVGVDADSISSVDADSTVQPETQNDSFNQLQCVEYLRGGKEKFLSLSLKNINFEGFWARGS